MHKKVFFVDVLVLLALVVFLLVSLLLEVFINKKEITEKSTYKLRCAECGKHFVYIHGVLNGDDDYIFRIQAKDTEFTMNYFAQKNVIKLTMKNLKFNKD